MQVFWCSLPRLQHRKDKGKPSQKKDPPSVEPGAGEEKTTQETSTLPADLLPFSWRKWRTTGQHCAVWRQPILLRYRGIAACDSAWSLEMLLPNKMRKWILTPTLPPLLLFVEMISSLFLGAAVPSDKTCTVPWTSVWLVCAWWNWTTLGP